MRDLNNNSPKLVEEAAQKILPHVPQKTREIANLGSGGSQIADLVVHPKGGAVVRKTPILRNWRRETTSDAIHRAIDQRGFWNHIGEVSQGKGQFAHLKGYDGPINYHQYSPPKRKEGGKAIVDKYRRLQKERDSLVMEARKRPWTPERRPLYQKLSRVDERTDIQYSHIHNLPPKLDAETEAILAKVREEYPSVWDLRHSNFVGNKIVDLEPRRGVYQRYDDPNGFYTPRGAMKDPIGYSKKFFHSGLYKT